MLHYTAISRGWQKVKPHSNAAATEGLEPPACRFGDGCSSIDAAMKWFHAATHQRISILTTARGTKCMMIVVYP